MPILFVLFGLVTRHDRSVMLVFPRRRHWHRCVCHPCACFQESSCEADDQFDEFLILLNQYLLPTSPDEVNISSKMSKRMASFKTRYGSHLDMLFNVDFSLVDSLNKPGKYTWPKAPLSRSDTYSRVGSTGLAHMYALRAGASFCAIRGEPNRA